jgi:hypothetical protein
LASAVHVDVNLTSWAVWPFALSCVRRYRRHGTAKLSRPGRPTNYQTHNPHACVLKLERKKSQSSWNPQWEMNANTDSMPPHSVLFQTFKLSGDLHSEQFNFTAKQ